MLVCCPRSSPFFTVSFEEKQATENKELVSRFGLHFKAMNFGIGTLVKYGHCPTPHRAAVPRAWRRHHPPPTAVLVAVAGMGRCGD